MPDRNLQPDSTMSAFCFGVNDVVAARDRIGAHIRRTPLLPSTWLSAAGGAPVYLKLESLQVTGSFKARGALNAAMVLRERADLPRARGTADVVTASAGNHGRAIAWACETLGLRATVFTPASAPRAKTEPIRRHGATLHDVAADYEEAERLAQAFAAEHAVEFVSPYDHPDVMAGAGTVALEVLEDLGEVETILVPVGGGGLISGMAVAAKSLRQSAEIVGVEVEASSAYQAARAAGRMVRIDVGDTLADGLGGNVDPKTRTWPFVRDLVDRVIAVAERDLRQAVRNLLAHEHVLAEGAGAAAVAAVAAGLVPLAGRRAAVVLTGANMDLARLKQLL